MGDTHHMSSLFSYFFVYILFFLLFLEMEGTFLSSNLGVRTCIYVKDLCYEMCMFVALFVYYVHFMHCMLVCFELVSNSEHRRVICQDDCSRCPGATEIGAKPWQCLGHHDVSSTCDVAAHNDVIKRKHFPRYWPFVRGIHQSPVNSPHKGQWRGVFNVFLNLRMKNCCKQSWGWWFETSSCSLWRQCNALNKL